MMVKNFSGRPGTLMFKMSSLLVAWGKIESPINFEVKLLSKSFDFKEVDYRFIIMKKLPRSSILIDRLHKGFVVTCIAVTLYGTSVLAMRGYRYYTQVKPQLKQKQYLEQQNLLAEGSPENLKDVAPNLRV